MRLHEVLETLRIDVDERLLLRALTHSSYVNEHVEEPSSNERMEFLGDAVLELIISHHLFDHEALLDEGRLSSLRSLVVRAESLAEVARTLQLGSLLRLGRGEEDSGGRDKLSVLADAFEAVVAAIYLSQGYDAAGEFVLYCMRDLLETAFQAQPTADPKSRLEQWTQSQGGGVPVYRVVSREGPDHAPQFTVEVVVDDVTLGRGRGSSKQRAEEAAAREVLQQQCCGQRT